MDVFYSVLIFILGLAVGSFLSAFTYRSPKGISVKAGRSFCPHCKKTIAWYDNIPLLSFLILKEKCRNCGKKISPRYPLIEVTTALLFTAIYFFVNNCATSLQGLPLKGVSYGLNLAYFLTVTAILIAIFVIDFESMLIPDQLVFLLFGATFTLLLLSSNDNFYFGLFLGFSVSLVFLLLHLVTRGRGMGLGDVKLVLPLGIILGWPNAITWLFLSFVIGALVGIILIITKKASFGKQIAFGPFLVVSFFIALFWGEYLKNILIPFW